MEGPVYVVASGHAVRYLARRPGLLAGLRHDAERARRSVRSLDFDDGENEPTERLGKMRLVMDKERILPKQASMERAHAAGYAVT